MEKIVTQGMLYDFYGPLLTEHQREIYEMIVNDDMSLGEIADEKKVSRQAVHDIVKRCDKILVNYEEKLHLVKRFLNSKKSLELIESRLDSIDFASDEESIGFIKKEINKIYDFI